MTCLSVSSRVLVLALERVTVLVLGGAAGASGDAEDALGSGVMVCWLLQRSSWLGHPKSKHFVVSVYSGETDPSFREIDPSLFEVVDCLPDG